MKEFKTKVIINAPVEVIWQTLANVDNYAKFDPNCVKIEGKIEKGAYLNISSRLSPGRIFRVCIIELIKNNKMVWRGGLPFNLFTGTRTFTVFAKDDFTSEFHMSEIFSGIMPALFKKMVPDLSSAFNQFGAGLKNFIESRSRF